MQLSPLCMRWNIIIDFYASSGKPPQGGGWTTHSTGGCSPGPTRLAGVQKAERRPGWVLEYPQFLKSSGDGRGADRTPVPSLLHLVATMIYVAAAQEHQAMSCGMQHVHNGCSTLLLAQRRQLEYLAKCGPASAGTSWPCYEYQAAKTSASTCLHHRLSGKQDLAGGPWQEGRLKILRVIFSLEQGDAEIHHEISFPEELEQRGCAARPSHPRAASAKKR